MFRTLIIEDSSFFRQVLKEALKSNFQTMEIMESLDGQGSLQKINIFPPDLVLVDIKLPGESGLELTRKIKTSHPDIQVLILTSYDIPEYREAASRYGANYFLAKGSTTKEGILTLVRSILSEKKAPPPSNLSP